MSYRQFSTSSYCNIIKILKDKGFTIKDYHTAIAEEKHLILRHDVDISLEYAEKLATVERDINVKATYFVMVRSDLYNIHSKKNTKHLKKILSLGHEIGLHFDASLYNDSNLSLDEAAELECKILESAINTRVNVISFHRPEKKLYNYPELIAGRTHAYQPVFFSHMDYCSDSQGKWGHGHPLDRPLIKAMQLLTHPIWWVIDASEFPVEKLEIYIEKRKESIKDTLSSECKIYKKS